MSFLQERKTPAAGKRRSKRGSAEERRRKLIEAAVELFSHNGFGATPTRKIAEAAGVNEALLFRDFGNKAGLYSAILDHKAKEARTDESLDELHALAERKADREFVHCLIGKILESYETDPQYQRLMFYSALERHELSKIFNETRGLPIFTFLTQYIQTRQADGVFRSGDPKCIIFAIIGLPTYYAIVRRLFGVDVLGVSDQEAAEVFTDLVLDGIKKRNTVVKTTTASRKKSAGTLRTRKRG